MLRKALLIHLSRRRLLVSAAVLGAAGLPRLLRASEDDPLPATQRLNGWLESRYQFWLGRSPMEQAYLGLKSNADKWDNIGEAHQQDDHDRVQKELADLRENFHPAGLTPAGQLNYRLYEYRCETLLRSYPWRRHQYPVNQVQGWQQEIPTFLMNIHKVDTVQDANNYIARLNGVGALVDQVLEQMRLGEGAGVLAPKFAYTNVLRDCRNLLTGAPFDGAGMSPLWADITGKIDALAIDSAVKQMLRGEAVRALVTVVRPAFYKLIALCEEQQQRASTEDGVWSHPDGEAYYAHVLRVHTTTDMSAEEIHTFGLRDVARIHDEIHAIMTKVGFAGDLADFFTFVKNDPQFYYPQTAEGKAAYIARSKQIVARMRARLDEVFAHKPRAELVVKAVEDFREESATAAFYQSPGAFDGRPGTYYVNTFDMKVMSKYEMESLAYHEAIPGHHMQIALAQEQGDLPQFRRFGGYTAYDEGWGLYCEQLAKEMGFYEDPYSDFGRLSSELWRACRLVVDTGIHMPSTRWTRADVIAYLTENTPNTATDITNSAERYIVDPGQATAYKIGMANILELREAAKTRLAGKFDLREFHDVVLSNGSVPLTVLADIVDDWVKAKLA